MNNLPKHTTSKKKRVGRGYGSGKGGHTAGRGQKGQKSRSGYKSPRPGFEGGTMPLSRRLPKFRGFSRGYFDNKSLNIIISLEDLNSFKEGEVVSIESLYKKGVIPTKSKSVKVKVLANGKLQNKKVKLEGLSVSDSAKKTIEKMGGIIN